MSIENVLAAHQWRAWECSCGFDNRLVQDEDEHLAEAIRAHLLSPAVIARAGLTIWPDATHPDDRAWAEDDARAVITAALGVEL